MKTLKILVVSLTLSVIGAVGFGMHKAMHSNLFQVEAVDVTVATSSPPMDEGEVLALASVPVGRVSLFELDLKVIQDRLLANDWIKEVHLEKKFPHTLMIGVKFREPVAIIQSLKGKLVYVDSEGKRLGAVSLRQNRDLPVFTGFRNADSQGDQEVLMGALEILKKWQSVRLDEVSTISSIAWEPNRGFRILVAYPLGGLVSDVVANPWSQARTMVDLGMEVDSSMEERLFRLSNVLRYLSRSSIVSRQIWANVGKKVVVKTVHGS